MIPLIYPLAPQGAQPLASPSAECLWSVPISDRNYITKVDILSSIVPNNKHLPPFVDFVLTLGWGQLVEWFCCRP